MVKLYIFILLTKNNISSQTTNLYFNENTNKTQKEFLIYNGCNAFIFILLNFFFQTQQKDMSCEFNIWFFPLLIFIHEVFNSIYILFFKDITFFYGDNFFKNLNYLQIVKILLSLLIFIVLIYFNINTNTNFFKEKNQHEATNNKKLIMGIIGYILYMTFLILIFKGFREKNNTYKSNQSISESLLYL